MSYIPPVIQVNTNTTNATPKVAYSVPLSTNQAVYIDVEVIATDSAHTAVGNRLLTANGADLTVAPYQTAALGYDTVNQQWHVIKFVG